MASNFDDHDEINTQNFDLKLILQKRLTEQMEEKSLKIYISFRD